MFPKEVTRSYASPTRSGVEASGLSHPGRKREENEDAFGLFPDERLFVLADGMGGRVAGAVAARMAVDELETFFREHHRDPRAPWPYPIDKSISLGANLVRVGLKVANDKIRAAAAADPAHHRMAATAAVLAIGETQMIAGNVGDVRVYRLRDGALDRLTRDHSLLEEMLAAKPDMSPAELKNFAHRNVVTRSLGSKPEVEPSVASQAVAPGDVYLLCCDGLWGSVDERRIAEIVGHNRDLEQGCQKLIDAANDAGGPDNITAILVRVTAE